MELLKDLLGIDLVSVYFGDLKQRFIRYFETIDRASGYVKESRTHDS